MGLPRENRLVHNAIQLKKNPTLTEKKLWYQFLREYPIHFRQQKIIGPYIVDFFCNKARISIELDGSQHYEAHGREYDQIRTNYMEMLEIKELRFANTEVWHNFEGVCEAIHREINKRRNDIIEISIDELKRKK